MKSWNVRWCETFGRYDGCIKVDAPTKIEAEDAAISILRKRRMRFSIVAVEEVRQIPDPIQIPPGCHYWGGQIRNNAEWRKRW